MVAEEYSDQSRHEQPIRYGKGEVAGDDVGSVDGRAHGRSSVLELSVVRESLAMPPGTRKHAR